MKESTQNETNVFQTWQCKRAEPFSFTQSQCDVGVKSVGLGTGRTGFKSPLSH